MNVLITGSAGLIGSRLVRYYKFLKHNVCEYDIDDDWEDNEYDIIHHCASMCILRDVIANPKYMFWNIEVTFRLLELVRKYEPKQLFLYSSNRVSSSEENPYVTSKKFLENAVDGYHNCYGTNYVIIRPETIWGYKKDDVRIMSNWIEKAITGEDIILYGDINKELSPLYVDDFVREVLGLDYNKNIGKIITITGEVRSAYDIAKTIINELDSESKIVFKDAELTQPQRAHIRDSDEIRLETDLVKDINNYKIYKDLFGNTD